MKTIKKLTLNRETLRDLMARNSGQVKGGDKSKVCGGKTANKKCDTLGCLFSEQPGCTVGCISGW